MKKKAYFLTKGKRKPTFFEMMFEEIPDMGLLASLGLVLLAGGGFGFSLVYSLTVGIITGAIGAVIMAAVALACLYSRRGLWISERIGEDALEKALAAEREIKKWVKKTEAQGSNDLKGVVGQAEELCAGIINALAAKSAEVSAKEEWDIFDKSTDLGEVKAAIVTLRKLELEAAAKYKDVLASSGETRKSAFGYEAAAQELQKSIIKVKENQAQKEATREALAEAMEEINATLKAKGIDPSELEAYRRESEQRN